MYKFIFYENELGLAVNDVLELLSVVQKPSFDDVFFDNFFSSYKIMTKELDVPH